MRLHAFIFEQPRIDSWVITHDSACYRKSCIESLGGEIGIQNIFDWFCLVHYQLPLISTALLHVAI